MTRKELSIIDENYISSKLKSVAEQLKNARQIDKIIEEYISMQLVDEMIKSEKNKSYKKL